MTEDFTLLKSEIRKAVKKANELNNCNDCTVTGYSYKAVPDELNFIQVTCEICHNYETRADYDVTIEVYLEDRRRSWAHEVF